MNIEKVIRQLNIFSTGLSLEELSKATPGPELAAMLNLCRNSFVFVPVDEPFFFRYQLPYPEARRLQVTLLQLRKEKEAQIKARDYATAATLREKELALYRQLYALLFPSEKLFVQLDDKTIGVKWDQTGAHSISQSFATIAFKGEMNSDKPDVRQE